MTTSSFEELEQAGEEGRSGRSGLPVALIPAFCGCPISIHAQELNPGSGVVYGTAALSNLQGPEKPG